MVKLLLQIDPSSGGDASGQSRGLMASSGVQINKTKGPADEGSYSDDPNTPLQSPKSQNTSREEEDDSSNANESDCKSPSQRYVGTDFCV